MRKQLSSHAPALLLSGFLLATSMIAINRVSAQDRPKPIPPCTGQELNQNSRCVMPVVCKNPELCSMWIESTPSRSCFTPPPPKTPGFSGANCQTLQNMFVPCGSSGECLLSRNRRECTDGKLNGLRWTAQVVTFGDCVPIAVAAPAPLTPITTTP
jgi:hypothetical protein